MTRAYSGIMYDDVVDLRDFYQSRLGQVTRRILRQRISKSWPKLDGLTVMGLGYATPFLRQLREDGVRTIACMPASQGVLRWPPDELNAVFLADESELPLPDGSIDRILLVHALERSEQVRPMLREIWRVLASNGRLLVIAPNRRGIWARLDRTPFGSGSPYSPGQLSRLLRDNLFTPTEVDQALYVPPSNGRMMLRMANTLEGFGGRWFPTVAGVVLVEASKQLYAVPPPRKIEKRRQLLIPAMPGARRDARQDV